MSILDVEFFEEPKEYPVTKAMSEVKGLVDRESFRLLQHYSVGRLYECDNGRLGLNGHDFHCGEVFEVFRPIHGTGTTGRWCEVRIEHTNRDGQRGLACWYLVGDARQGGELIGIIARRPA